MKITKELNILEKEARVRETTQKKTKMKKKA
jgi:hypothetical protein